jgi:hypothetical protein
MSPTKSVIVAVFILSTRAHSQEKQDIRILTLDRPIERQMASGDVHWYQTALSGNQFLRVIIDQRGIDVVVKLFSPEVGRFRKLIAQTVLVDQRLYQFWLGSPVEDSGQLANPRIDLATALERRIHLKQLWREICQLALRHRAAILLNLRDEQGRGVITLLPVTRVATIRQIA